MQHKTQQPRAARSNASNRVAATFLTACAIAHYCRRCVRLNRTIVVVRRRRLAGCVPTPVVDDTQDAKRTVQQDVRIVRICGITRLVEACRCFGYRCVCVFADRCACACETLKSGCCIIFPATLGRTSAAACMRNTCTLKYVFRNSYDYTQYYTFV